MMHINTHHGCDCLLQDKAASDSMDPAMDAMRLNMLVRRGVSLVRGLIIKQVMPLAQGASSAQSVNNSRPCPIIVAAACGPAQLLPALLASTCDMYIPFLKWSHV